VAWAVGGTDGGPGTDPDGDADGDADEGMGSVGPPPAGSSGFEPVGRSGGSDVLIVVLLDTMGLVRPADIDGASGFCAKTEDG
jgi:hypothetical protein